MDEEATTTRHDDAKFGGTTITSDPSPHLNKTNSSPHSNKINTRKRPASPMKSNVSPTTAKQKSIQNSGPVQFPMPVDAKYGAWRMHQDSRKAEAALVMAVSQIPLANAQMNGAVSQFESLDRVMAPLLRSGYLTWYEAMKLGSVNRNCRVVWIQERETVVDWKTLLTALIDLNHQNGCKECGKRPRVVKPLARLEDCTVREWTKEIFKRTPNFVCCMDIVAQSNFLNSNEKETINSICEAANISLCSDPLKYRQSNPFPYRQDWADDYEKAEVMIQYLEMMEHSNPFLKLFDPRYQHGYELDWTDYEKFEAMIRYTQIMVHQMHTYLGSDDMFNPHRLPSNLANAIPQKACECVIRLYCKDCPKRLAFIRHLSFLHVAQLTILSRLPSWYGTAFLAHDEIELYFRLAPFLNPSNKRLVHALRQYCYPSKEVQEMLGPLLNQVSIYSPFFQMVPMDDSQPVVLQDILEDMTAKMIELASDSDSDSDSYSSSEYDSYIEYDSDFSAEYYGDY